MNGLTPLPDNKHKLSDSVITMSDANYKKCGGSKWFVMDGGKARLKNEAEIKAMEDAEAKDTARKAAKEARDEALRNCTVEVNGNVYQARPSDEANFRVRIMSLEAGQETQWLLENDQAVTVTKEDLEQVYSSGLQKVGSIWDDYINVVDAL